MRAILIDPFEQTLTDVWLEKDGDSTLESIRAQLQCRTIAILSVGKDQLGRPVDLIHDDEGRIIGGQRCFMIGELLMAGRAILASHDDMGITTGCGLSIEQAAGPVSWLPEDTDYEPAEPIMLSFDTLDEMLAAMRRQ